MKKKKSAKLMRSGSANKSKSIQKTLRQKVKKPLISHDEARKFLTNVRPENSFWINNGPIINNLKNLPKAIEETDETTFMHHVNSEKNDFSKWIQECIGDNTLAQDLKKIRTKDEFVKKLKKRVTLLKEVLYAEG